MKLLSAEVVLIRMQFLNAPGSKIRPALVLLDTGDDDFVAAPISSQARLSDFDLALGDWHEAGLNVASTVRIHKLSVLPKSDIVRRIGACSTADQERLSNLLCRIFCPT